MVTAKLVGVVLAGPADAPPAAPTDRATMAAELLVTLDKEAPPVSKRKRLAAQKTLERLGVHPLDDAVEVKPVAMPYRGRVLGPGYQHGWLDAGAEMKLEQQFLAGQRATIAVAGAPAAALKLTVAEPGEQPVCLDAARACRWLPLYTGRYAVTLRNPGAARVRYYLVFD